jgi:hypothetical protein
MMHLRGGEWSALDNRHFNHDRSSNHAWKFDFFLLKIMWDGKPEIPFGL